MTLFKIQRRRDGIWCDEGIAIYRNLTGEVAEVRLKDIRQRHRGTGMKFRIVREWLPMVKGVTK